MLVDVVRLRQNGNKLPPDVVKGAGPVRGRLTIRAEPWRERWTPNAPAVLTTFAYLKTPRGDDPLVESLLPALRMAHVKTMADDAFVVLGLERTSHEIGREVDCPQAWWCRLACRCLVASRESTTLGMYGAGPSA